MEKQWELLEKELHGGTLCIIFLTVLANQVLKIRGPACHFSLCDDVNFHVLDTDGAELALISKRWMGCFKEALTDADNFVIDFNDNLTIETKVLIFAATFLIDMMYFEMNN